jgi:hypothetical protein
MHLRVFPGHLQTPDTVPTIFVSGIEILQLFVIGTVHLSNIEITLVYSAFKTKLQCEGKAFVQRICPVERH